MNIKRNYILATILFIFFGLAFVYLKNTSEEIRFTGGMVIEINSEKIVIENDNKKFDAELHSRTEVVRIVNILGKMVEEKIKSSDITPNTYAKVYYRSKTDKNKEATRIEIR